MALLSQSDWLTFYSTTKSSLTGGSRQLDNAIKTWQSLCTGLEQKRIRHSLYTTGSTKVSTYKSNERSIYKVRLIGPTAAERKSCVFGQPVNDRFMEVKIGPKSLLGRSFEENVQGSPIFTGLTTEGEGGRERERERERDNVVVPILLIRASLGSVETGLSHLKV